MKVMLGIYWGFIGMMENKMETTIQSFSLGVQGFRVQCQAFLAAMALLDIQTITKKHILRVNRTNAGACGAILLIPLLTFLISPRLQQIL